MTIHTYNVIYNLIDDVKAAMEGKLRTVEERQPMGAAEVKAVFGSGKRKVRCTSVEHTAAATCYHCHDRQHLAKLTVLHVAKWNNFGCHKSQGDRAVYVSSMLSHNALVTCIHHKEQNVEYLIME